MIYRALSIFTNLYAVWVIGASALAFVAPELFLWFSGPWITYALAIIMLGMGLTLRYVDFRRIWEMPWPVGVGFVLQYTVMPLTAWTIATLLKLDTPFTVGLILVACCPGGTASNLVAFLAKANVALSVVLTMVSTLLAIVMTPLLMKYWAGQYVPVDAWGIFKTTFQVVLVPILLGVYLNQRFPKIGKVASHIGPAVAVIAIVMIAGSIVASNVEAIIGQGFKLALAGFLLHSIGFILGYFFTRLLRFPQRTARTISIEVGMQNSGLAMVLAQQHFSPITATPAVFSSIFHTIVGSLCAAYWRLKPVTDEGPMNTSGRRNIYYWKCDRPSFVENGKQPEHTIDSEKIQKMVKDVLQRHLPGHEFTIECLNDKGDHLTFVASQNSTSYFVRVQTGIEGDDYMDVESRVISDVRNKTGVPTAKVILHDASRVEVPFAYQALEHLPYKNLNQISKQNGNALCLEEIATRIGKDVARWQGIQPLGFGPFDTSEARENNQLRGFHPDYRSYYFLNLDRHLDFLHKRDFLSIEEHAKIHDVVDRHNDLLKLDGGVLVHKDLALWNILGTEEGVKAYIDWDDTISGDPTDDLSLMACFHDVDFVHRGISGYRSIRALPEDFSRRFWLHLLRNMLVKSVIRVGYGYFGAKEDLFLKPVGCDGNEFKAFTKNRLLSAVSGLDQDWDVLKISTFEN